MFQPGFRRLGLLKSAGQAKAVKHGWLWLGFGLSCGLWWENTQ
jgi:hypothetical protein